MITALRPIPAIGAVALLALASVVVADPVDAAPVGCGSVVTVSTTLTADIGPCPRGGITIGADNIVLDLGGRRIVGKTNRTGDGVGITLNGRTGVVVQNGTVSQFDAGIAILGGSANTIQRVTASYNVGTVRGDFGDGIAISASSDNQILDNNVTNNGPFDGIGLFGASLRNLLEGNVVASNDVPATGDDGIRIEGPGAADNVVRANTVTASTLDGIAVFALGGNTGNIIEENVVSANGYGHLGARPGDGIRLFIRANGNIVRNNTVTDNAGNGIIAQYSASNNTGASGNSFLTNTATGNSRVAGATPSYDLHDRNPGCDANIWAGNVFGTSFPACTAG